MSAKQCRPWSDATFCSIWSGSTLFAHAWKSQYLGLSGGIMNTEGMPKSADPDQTASSDAILSGSAQFA